MAEEIENKELGIIEISKLKNAPGLMKNNTYLTEVDCPFPELLTANEMFYNCTALSKFTTSQNGTGATVDLPKVTSAYGFLAGTGIASINVNTPNLLDAHEMFYNCTALDAFTTQDENSLKSVTNAKKFLAGTGIPTITLNMPNATNATEIFKGCNRLATVNVSMAKLGTTSGDSIELELPNNVNHIRATLPKVKRFKLPKDLVTLKNSDLSSVKDGNELLGNSPDQIQEITDTNLSSVTTFGGRTLPNTLTKFQANVSSLADGSRLFYNCENCEQFDFTSLSNLTNGEQMFMYCDKLSSFNYSLDKLTQASSMFYNCSALEEFSAPTSSIDSHSLTDGSYMFWGCSNLSKAYLSLGSLVNGKEMFYGCSNLYGLQTKVESGYVNVDLGKLENGSSMFSRCSALNNFYPNMASLSNANYMFSYSGATEFGMDNTNDVKLGSLQTASNMFRDCAGLTKVYINSPKLVDASSMFYHCSALNTVYITNPPVSGAYSAISNGAFMFKGCSALTTFDKESCNLSGLKNGEEMFYNCTALTTFNGELKNLLTGWKMFHNCKLSEESLDNIRNSIHNLKGDGLCEWVKDEENEGDYKREDKGTDDQWSYYVWTDEASATPGNGGTTNLEKVIVPSNKRGIIHIDASEDVSDAYRLDYEHDMREMGWKVEWCEAPEVGGFDISSVNKTVDGTASYVDRVDLWRDEVYVGYELQITKISNKPNDRDGISGETVGVMYGTSKYTRD